MLIRCIALFLAVFISACSQSPEEFVLRGQTMGTNYNITVVNSAPGLNAEALRTLIEETLADVNADFSNWDPGSEVSRFNAQQTLDDIPISPEFLDLMTLANTIHEQSGGKFDLTLAPLVDLWGFGPDGRVVKAPEEDEIAAAKTLVGQRRVLSLNKEQSSLRKTVATASVNLAGIAKGSGIDAVAARLSDAGAQDFIVEIGGDLYATGQTVRATPWQIGVERPEIGAQRVEEIVSVSGLGMATSGDYRNYFAQDGVRFSHIIDSETGAPITHATASVTVLAGSAAEADGWATALLALGYDQGAQIAEDLDLAALFIVRRANTSPAEFDLLKTGAFDRLQKTKRD